MNYVGLHYIHFTVSYSSLSADKTVGFLITPTNSSISKTAAAVKKGYITRKFTATKKSRNVFMFLHEDTAYDLTSGSTDIPFIAGNTASDTSFETSDILQENTTYKIRVYDGDNISEQTFTTKSFADGDASSTGAIAYMGGLIAATKKDVSLTIERKLEEIMLVPYANDSFVSNDIIYKTTENNNIQGGCSPNCASGFPGLYIYDLRIESNKLISIVLMYSPQRTATSIKSLHVGEGIVVDKAFNIEIISE